MSFLMYMSGENCPVLKNKYPEMKKKNGMARGAICCEKTRMKVLAKGNEAHPSLSVVKLQCRNNTSTMSGNRRKAMTFDCKSVGFIERGFVGK
jgi:hypothetical protein